MCLLVVLRWLFLLQLRNFLVKGDKFCEKQFLAKTLEGEMLSERKASTCRKYDL